VARAQGGVGLQRHGDAPGVDADEVVQLCGLTVMSQLWRRHGAAELWLGEDGSRRQRCMERSSGKLGWHGGRRSLASRAPRGSARL
jgi:hypothetical protein